MDLKRAYFWDFSQKRFAFLTFLGTIEACTSFLLHKTLQVLKIGTFLEQKLGLTRPVFGLKLEPLRPFGAKAAQNHCAITRQI